MFPASVVIRVSFFVAKGDVSPSIHFVCGLIIFWVREVANQEKAALLHHLPVVMDGGAITLTPAKTNYCSGLPPEDRFRKLEPEVGSAHALSSASPDWFFGFSSMG
jgi:hypothetical protein